MPVLTRILLICGITLSLYTANTLPADFNFKLESKISYRESEQNHWPVNFPFPAEVLPQGQNSAWLETVEAGKHLEVSNIALFWNWSASDKFKILGKIDAIDLYERNPTSSDHEISIDRLIFRYGKKYAQGNLPENTDYYLQFGKFGKFERQEDRHTESYGLASTAFNRVEDSGFEMGIDTPSGMYIKLSYTSGNPVFIRDPNALAGDNGAAENTPDFFDPELKVGVPILYDAEVEGLDLSKTPETGVAIGYRWLSSESANRINLMAYHYEREMADTIALHGTFYGADLDLLDLSEVIDGLRLATTHRNKEETGFNLWWYSENTSLFAQYVYQDIAGLQRDGWEVELAYSFNTSGDFGETGFIERIIPVIRYSELTNDFGGPAVYPSPSLWWDWSKTDIGFSLEFSPQFKLTTEYAITQFVRGGRKEENNELLLTFTWRYN